MRRAQCGREHHEHGLGESSAVLQGGGVGGDDLAERSFLVVLGHLHVEAAKTTLGRL